ncbi:YkvS family protein [Paenisporosarcina macmurdoensis]|uniref:YkvS family protein n=1 Tax=Paenisporosarcina macmurdoensis TaxID=212659 RepID=A0ABW1L3P1_9BACL
MEIATVGSIIEFKDGLQGIVEKVNENSVIVNISIMDNFEELEVDEKTVVNHKRYKIVYLKEEESSPITNED